MTSITLRLASLAVCLGGAVAAQDLSLPGNATLTREVIRDPGSYALPTARWSEDAGLPVRVFEGAVERL